ncbi:MAG: DUF5060 domain-containing protein [Planctomycetota bacterium]
MKNGMVVPLYAVLAWSAVVGVVFGGEVGNLSSGGQATANLWSPLELTFVGLDSDESSSTPNVFRDYRLQVEWQAPSGAIFDVPGFFDGDGQGSGEGDVWKARFTPDEVGSWTWTASFRQGDDVSISLDPDAGSPVFFDGATGTVDVDPPEGAKGFQGKGRLQYVGEHYLRFQDGTYFLKTGTNSPENLLGYSGFDNVQDVGGLANSVIHDYAPHVSDWNPGDPEEGTPGSPNGIKGLIGALNYLSSQGVNAVYFLPMNMGGDGQETTPFLTYVKTEYGKTHYDVSRLEQWNTVLNHAMRKGIQLQFVLSETEWANENWLDDGQLGLERKLFFRELVARFAHHNAIKWNLAEENDYSVPLLRDMAEYLAAVDPYDHPITVHTKPDDFEDYFALLGDDDFSMSSIQYLNKNAGEYVEEWRANTAAAGRPWVIDMDENGTPDVGVSDENATEMRKEVLYDVLFSGGNVEWYLGGKSLPLGGDQSLEDFRTRSDIWRYSRYARRVLEDHFEFWKMDPADQLLNGESQAFGGGEVFQSERGDTAIYLPDASPSGSLDLTAFNPTSRFLFRWRNPRNGQDVGLPWSQPGGDIVGLGEPPSDPNSDWVMIVKRLDFFADTEEVSVGSGEQTLFIDAGPEHAFETYQILSSASGIHPGTAFGDVILPLNWDAFTDLTLFSSAGFSTGFFGVLNGNGRATAQLDVGGVLSPLLVGFSLDHAFLSAAGGFNDGPDWASNAVPMKIVP